MFEQHSQAGVKARDFTAYPSVHYVPRETSRCSGMIANDSQSQEVSEIFGNRFDELKIFEGCQSDIELSCTNRMTESLGRDGHLRLAIGDMIYYNCIIYI